MALRDQPYLPLYIMDFMTDEKLIECSAESTGVYIRLMCIMHKSEEYGTILLWQKDKQNDSNIKNFAIKLSRQMPYDVATIEKALTELIEEKVLILDGDKLYQKRMVKDNLLSQKRAISGKKGSNSRYGNQDSTFCHGKTDSKHGSKAGSKTEEFAMANSMANTENEIEYEYENNIDIQKEKSKNNTSLIDERFIEFWKSYPRKTGKGATEKVFKRISPTKELFEQIMKALELAKQCDQWKKDNGQFIPYPSTWLNQKRWEDEYTTPSGSKTATSSSSDNPFADWGEQS